MLVERATGIVIAQRYRLDRCIGEGGMGEVWAATHLVTRKSVALKFLKDAGPDARRRMIREARAASAVKHPNVVQFHDVLELDDGAPVLVMDLLVGESLGQCLDRKGRLAVDDVAGIMAPVISAVGTGHAVGIIHRDLKPDNIFLVELPEGRRDVRVLDFGIAKLTASAGDAAHSGVITQSGDMLGTPYYMAPEQAFGQADIDHRADIWALGIILYECLAGQRPVRGNNVGQILHCILVDGIAPLESVVAKLPRELTALVGKMLSRERGERLSDLRQVHEVLARYTTRETPSFGEARPLSNQVTLPAAAVDAHAPTGIPEALAPTVTPGEMAATASPVALLATTPAPARGAGEIDPFAHTTAKVGGSRRWSIPVIGGAVALASLGVWSVTRAPSPPRNTQPSVTALPAMLAPSPLPLAEPPKETTAPPPAVKEKPARHVEPHHRVAAKPAKPEPAPPPPEDNKRLPGGLTEKAPF